MLRKNPNVLLAGDRISIPPLREKAYARPTEKRHRFRILGVPAKFRLQIMESLKKPDRQPGRTANGSSTKEETERSTDRHPVREQSSRMGTQPRANVPYVLEIDGKLTRGCTDSEGVIESSIPPNARTGRLILEPWIGWYVEGDELGLNGAGRATPPVTVIRLVNRTVKSS